MTKHLKISAVALLVGATYLLPGCYPKGAEYVDELDLVYTNYDNTADFSQLHTYAIPDSVVKITDATFQDDGSGKPKFVSATYGTVMLAEIMQNLNSNGWTRVDKNNNPDVLVLVSSMVTQNIFYYYDWGYWGWWYPPYYGGGWGWYYPYYPPYPYVSSYLSGSIFIQMVKNKPALAANGENVPVIWSSIINGLAEGGTSSITARIQTTIDKAFTQSPYLKH